MDDLLRAPIVFTATDGSTVHSPMINARVGGAEMLFVLDTGSEVHLLTKELADELGLQLAEGEEGVDHSGATMPSWTAGDVRVRVGEHELTLGDVVVIPAPAPFPGRGIGGILSPQGLEPTAWAVVDLVRDELLVIAAGLDELASWLAKRSPELTTIRLDRDGKTPTPVVRAAIKPFAETEVMLNTGGRGTEFDVTAVPELEAGDAERLGGGVSGSDVMGSLGGEQILAVGGAELHVPRLALRERMPYPYGLVGMDVLRGTVLACNSDPGGRVFWQVPRSD